MMFGVHAHAVLQMTIAKIRKAYNKIDSKSIAKQVLTLLNYRQVGGFLRVLQFPPPIKLTILNSISNAKKP
jgi:hypothetical protein